MRLPSDPAALRTCAAIVTGASSGLGRATALLLAEAGRPVAVWGTDTDRTHAVAAECRALGVRAVAVIADVADRAAVVAAAEQSRRELGPIGAVACCAARLRVTPVGHVDPQVWDEMLRVNLGGIANALEATLPMLREVGSGASFVAVASTESFRGSPYLAAYAAAKHGVLGLVKSAARSLAAEGIRVNAVCAGAMDTPMMTSALAAAGGEPVRQQMIANIPLGYISDPREVGYVIRFLLSPEASYVTGVALPVDGGMLA